MKNNKGFMGIGLILVIILGVVVVGGGAYFFGKNSSKVVPVVEENQNDVINNQQPVESNLTFKKYINTKAGYEISYPKSWIIKADSNSASYGAFSVVNIQDAILEGTDFSMKSDGSVAWVQVTYNTSYSTVEDSFNSLSTAEKNRRLVNISNMNIGGVNLKVWHTKGNLPDENYSFVYNKNLYNISFISGSLEQFNKDKEIFTDFLSSFKFISNTETNNQIGEWGDDVNGKHIGYIKSVSSSGGKYSLTVDYVEWLTEKIAIRAALEDGECSIEGKSKAQAIQELQTYDMSMGYGIYGNCAPNGYFIRNQNTKLRTFSIASNVNITTITKPTGDGLYSDPELHQEPISIVSFKPLFQNNTMWTKYIPFWITLRDGIITEIIEQYIP